MTQKKALIIGPILAQWAEIKYIENSLQFLKTQYDLHFIDPLADLKDQSAQDFFQSWEEKLARSIEDYQLFIGFSLGGVIVQHCSYLFKDLNKKIILFSTPTFIDDALREKLTSVTTAISENSLTHAVTILNDFVFYPEKNLINEEYKDVTKAKQRLIKGFEYVLTTNNLSNIKQYALPYLHLIGEESMLVNNYNVAISKLARLAIVPKAGMRVLQHKPDYCIELINDYLQGGIYE